MREFDPGELRKPLSDDLINELEWEEWMKERSKRNIIL